MPQHNRRYEASSLNRRGPGKWTQKTREEVLTTIASASDATAFIAEFVAIIGDHRRVLPNAYIGLLEFAPYLDATDLLRCLDRQIRDGTVSYTTRLSEAGAGWGTAAPSTLANADPLDLVTTLEGLGCNVLVCDAQAVDDGSASSTDGPVQVKVNTRTCYQIDGTIDVDATAKSPGTSLFSDVNTYRYRFLGGPTPDICLRNMTETGGGNYRYGQSTKPTIVLWRAGTDYERPNAQVLTIKLVGGASQNDYILWRGYPGEQPVFRVSCDAGTSFNGVFRHENSGLFRSNVWYDSIDFYGRTGTEGAYHFANRIMQWGNTSTGGRMLRCTLQQVKAISPADDRAASYPGYVDQDYAAKAAGAHSQSLIQTSGKNFLAHACYFENGDTDLPGAGTGSDTAGHAIDIQGTTGTSWSDRGATISRCQFAGQAGHGQVRIQSGTQYVLIEDCDLVNGDNTCITMYSTAASPANNIWIRRNRIHDWGTLADIETEGLGIQVNGVSDVTIEDNVIYQNVTPVSTSFHRGVAIVRNKNDTDQDVTNVVVRRNALWKCGVCVQFNAGQAVVTDDEIYGNTISDNVIVDFTTGEKSGVTDAPIYINLYDPITNDLWDHVVTSNVVSYDTSYDDTDPIAIVRTGAATSVDVAEAGTYTGGGASIMPGFSGNEVLDPGFADADNGNFTMSNATAAAKMSSSCPLAETPAWNS